MKASSTMTYSELTAMCRNKFKGYTLNECHFAMRDIYDTLRFVSRDMSDPYVVKLYAELDAVRDRRDALSKGEREAVASRRAPSTTDET
jgi:hypothetical protein